MDSNNKQNQNQTLLAHQSDIEKEEKSKVTFYLLKADYELFDRIKIFLFKISFDRQMHKID